MAPNPEPVLTGALNNIIRITRNEQCCPVHGRPLADHGLTWRELVAWWTDLHRLPADTERDNALQPHYRLERSMKGNGLEKEFFQSLFGVLWKQVSSWSRAWSAWS
ncbi:hypothetical protein [Kitasatospora sp. NPDC056181]|uniref:hypothetical protein n=1 Tax=Kitasatospora sp. NPDC056181 TaxID=3345737 RepID=UPI0035D8C690